MKFGLVLLSLKRGAIQLQHHDRLHRPDSWQQRLVGPRS